MSGTGTADPTTEDAPGDLRRSLGFRDLVVYGLLFIAPMAPVGVYGTLDAKSHGAVALVYPAATVAMAFTAFSYAQMVRVAPQAGSVFAYARGARKGSRVRRGLDGDAGLAEASEAARMVGAVWCAAGLAVLIARRGRRAPTGDPADR